MSVYGAFEPGSFNAWTLNLFADVFVNPGVARGMQVTAPGGMQVNVTLDATANDGVCYLSNGCFLRIDSVQSFAVPNNSTGGTRTDAVVAFVDPSGVSSPSVSLTYVTNWSSGFTPGNNNQLVIALVSVPNLAAAISAGNITNTSARATLIGTSGSSNSMVAADGVGLSVQDNSSSSLLSVVLTGLTTGVGRSIAIQTTDVSAIGHAMTIDQGGNVSILGNLSTTGNALLGRLTADGGKITTNGTGLQAWHQGLTGSNQLMDWEQGYGLFSDNTGSSVGWVGGPGTERLWFNAPGNNVAEMHFGPRNSTVLMGARFMAANFIITASGASTPGTFSIQGGMNVSLDNNKISSDGNGNLNAATLNGRPSAGPDSLFLYNTSGSHYMSMGINSGGDFFMYDHTNNAYVWNGITSAAPIQTTRNGATTAVAVFTGTAAPVNPPTGSVWVKA